MVAASSPIAKEVLDDLTVRFIIQGPEFILLRPEEYFFTIEEAYWFALDFYKIQDVGLPQFASLLLAHNNIPTAMEHDYNQFKIYKQSVKVYGVMMFNPEMTHCLLVQQQGSSTAITFPKGKKSKNETGIECAIRETYEEVGYDVTNKIVDIPITIFEKITLYFVLNVRMDTPFHTQTRNEISRIFWFDLRKFDAVRLKKNHRLFVVAYSQASKVLERMKANMFRFDIDRIDRVIDGTVRKLKAERGVHDR